MSEPILDFRDVEAFYQQELELAHAYTPDWANYWPSNPPSEQDIDQDPGLVLLKLFAQLANYTAQIENQIPNQRQLGFFQFMNMQLRPPVPSQAALQFKLDPDQPMQKVPKATAVLVEKQEDLRFQTVQDLQVLPATLSAAMSLIPAQDAFINLLPVLDGSQAGPIPVFVAEQCVDGNEQELGHWFMLGDPSLFKPDDSLQSITIKLQGKQLYPEYFGQWFDGDLHALGAQLTSLDDYRQLQIELTTVPTAGPHTLEEIQQELYLSQEADAGFSPDPLALAQPEPEYWLLVEPAPEVKVLATLEAELPVITALECVFHGKQIQPQQAAFDVVLLDITNGAYPFGQSPQKNDTFYLRSDTVFARTGAQVTLFFQFVPVAVVFPVTLYWQFWDGKQWQPFNQSATDVATYQFVDTTNNFQTLNADGSPNYIQFVCPQMEEVAVAGNKGLWIRVVLADGGYGQDGGFTTTSVSATIGAVPDSVLDQNDKDKLINYLNNVAGVNFSYTFTASKYYPPFIQAVQITYSYSAQPSSYWCYNAFNLSRFLFSPFKPVTEQLASFNFALEAESFLAQAPGQRLCLYFYLAQEQAHPVEKLEWQYNNGTTWLPLAVDDATYGLSRSGIVNFVVPKDLQAAYLFSQSACWFRIVNAHVRRTIRIYGMYPNAVQAQNITSVWKEVLGSGNGQQFQSFNLSYAPVLPNLVLVVIETRGLQQNGGDGQDQNLVSEQGQAQSGSPSWGHGHQLSHSSANQGLGSSGGRGSVVDQQRMQAFSRKLAQQTQDMQQILAALPGDAASLEQVFSQQSAGVDISDLQLAADEVPRVWRLVENFTFSGPTDRVFTLDYQNGLITFGDGYNGMIPPLGHNNIIAAYYEYTQGLSANVGAGRINILRPGIANIASVQNPAPSAGGVGGDNVAHLQETSPALVKAGGWAVQIEDFSTLAQAASPQVAQARAQAVTDSPAHLIQIAVLAESADPVPYTSPQLLNTVQDYVRQYCLANLVPRIRTCAPDFVPINVTAQLLVEVAPDQINALQQSVESCLQAYFQPVFGGSTQQGWQFGQTVQASSLNLFLRKIPQVKLVLSLNVNGVQNGNVSLEALQLPVAGSMQVYLLQSGQGGQDVV